MHKVIDKIMISQFGGWLSSHMPPKWLAPSLSLVSIILSVSAMVLAIVAK